jgi:hypothetical protein
MSTLPNVGCIGNTIATNPIMLRSIDILEKGSIILLPCPSNNKKVLTTERLKTPQSSINFSMSANRTLVILAFDAVP